MQRYDEPEWLRGDETRHLVFNTLVTWLDDASTSSDTKALLDSTITALLAIGGESSSAESYRFESGVLFAAILTLVKQTPAAATQQEYLVELVLKLRQVPIPSLVAQDVDPEDLDQEMNQDLFKLINVISDFERMAPLHPSLESRPSFVNQVEDQPLWREGSLSADEWTSISAFMARLHATAPDIPKLDLRGLFAMIEALEQPLGARPLEDVLPAAACWIVYAGSQLRSNDTPYANYNDDGGSKRLPWSRGEMWYGPHAFNEERWQFWMTRFEEIARRTDVSNKVRLSALNALRAGR